MKFTKHIVLTFLFVLAAPALAKADAPKTGTLARLKADLAGHESATQILTRWCGDLHLAAVPEIRAVRVYQDRPADAQVRAALQAGPNELLRYRRVRLMCGAHILSEADNWYRPSRLTPQMNEILDHTERSFGAVVRPLNFHRVTRTQVTRPDSRTVLRLTALLETPDGTPFSLVVENYRPVLLMPPRSNR